MRRQRIRQQRLSLRAQALNCTAYRTAAASARGTVRGHTRTSEGAARTAQQLISVLTFV